MSTVVVLSLSGLTFHALAIAAGTSAQLTGKRLGMWHHLLYLATCLYCISLVGILLIKSLFLNLLLLLPTIACLMVMPFTRPGTQVHAFVGIAGLIGWILLTALSH